MRRGWGDVGRRIGSPYLEEEAMREIKVFMVCEGTDPVVVRGAIGVYEAMREEMAGLDREVFYTICLSARNEIIGRHLVSIGSLTGATVHPREAMKAAIAPEVPEIPDLTEEKREIYRKAIRNNAAAVIFVHCHPSGNPDPSPEDRTLTKQLVEAGKILGIRVLDHLIIGSGQDYGAETERSFFSFADENLL